MLEIVIGALQRLSQAVDLVALGRDRRAQVLEVGRRRRRLLVALREGLTQVAQLLLPVGELALALVHSVPRFDLVLRLGNGLLALRQLPTQLLEVVFVGRQQLTLFLDLVLALVERELERRSRGPRVVPILLEPTA